MSEHGKEVQPIIVVVEENSENVVVQAFSRDSEAAGDEAAFTVNQLDNAISAALPEQLTGVETITTSEGQQLLVLSQDANGKLVSMEGTQVEHSAAVLDTGSSCHEVSKGNIAEQCAASPESSQMELQQECKILSEENGSSEVNAIPDNVHVPEESAECEYESESKPRKAAPIGVSKSSKTSSSDVPVNLGQGDSSKCREKPASSCREPVQVTEEKKNGIMDMNVGDNHSSDMTVPSVQSIKPGTEVHLNTSKMPSAPLIVGEKLDTADILDADKYTKEDSPCAVWDSKSSETAGNTLEVSECQGQGARVQSMDDVCASQTSSKHFIIDTTTNPLLGKKNDKSLPVVAEHSEVPSKESLEVGQNTKVCSKRASQSANVEQQNEPLSQIIRCSSDSTTVTGPLHKSLEPGASKHSVILRADAAGLAKSRVGHPPQCQTKGNASVKNVSILKPQAWSPFASSYSEASSSALHKKQESLEEKEGTKCTRYGAVEDEKSASHPVSTAVEKSLESRYEHADFNIQSLPADPEELSQTSHSGVVHNIDKPEEESTSAKLYCAHQKTNKPGQISLKGETLKVQPAASILSSNVITDNEKAKSQLIEKDNPLTELCDVLKENSQSTLDHQTKSIQKEEAFQLSQVKTSHEMPKKQSDKMTLIPVTSSYAESKLQGSPHNESHKASQERESESVQEEPSDATLVADQGSQPNITKEHCEVQPQASSELDTEENELQKETTDSIDILPGKLADNIEMHISKCHDSKNVSEHSTQRDDVGQLQELHDSEHQVKDACEKTEIRAKAFNQDIQEQVEGLTTVTDMNITNVPETYTSLEKGAGKSSAKGPPTDKLLAALDLVPRPPDDSAKEQDVTAEEPCPASATSDLGNGETKPENECLDEQEDDTPSKKRWSLRTPTKPRKRVIIPDSDDEDFEAYVSEDVQPVTQKSKSEEAFDVLLDFFKKEQAQKAAVETVAMRKRSARKVGRLPSKSSSARSRSSDANSTPFEKEPAVKAAKVKDVVKPTVRKSQPVHTSCTTSQATAVKQARKRRSEPVKVVPHKKSVGDGAGSRIPSMSDTFAGDIRIRCQKPNSSMDKMTSRYHCSKCGFRSARMENIVRHHKQDCPYSKQQPAWDSKALKSTNSALA
uniref:Neurofilament heavy polypeptide n=1 Tax=Rhipicephalus appendiculatus TaxID=34631 RepID=A0A131YDF0_RHIAP